MSRRDRAIYATSALLYLGPLYAGLAGYGFETIPVFAPLFVLWLWVVKPGRSLREKGALRDVRGLARFGLILVGQLVLVGFCLAVGRGMGGLVGLVPPLPLVFTLLVSMLAIALARLLQPKDTPASRRTGTTEGATTEMTFPGHEAVAEPEEVDAQVAPIVADLGPTRVTVSRPTASGRTPRPQRASAVSAPASRLGDDDSWMFDEEDDDGGANPEVKAFISALAELNAAGESRSEIDRYVEYLDGKDLIDSVLAALNDAPHEHIPFIQAQVTLALRPRVAARLAGTGQIGEAFDRALATRVPFVMRDAVVDARALLPEVPRLIEDLPISGRLLAAARDIEEIDPDAASFVRALADDISQRVAA